MSGGDDDFILPPRSHASSPGKDLGAGERTITGVLGFDNTEGGCAFVETADGRRYEVIYPEGWTVDRSSGELRADDGRIGRVGDAITVRGSPATGRSSICQIGPIILARDVVLGARQAWAGAQIDDA